MPHYVCEHNGCTDEAFACFDETFGDDPDAYYCHEHAMLYGYCVHCGMNEMKVGYLDEEGLCPSCQEFDRDELWGDYL